MNAVKLVPKAWMLCVLLLAFALTRPASAGLVDVDKADLHDAVYVMNSDLHLTDFHSSIAGTVKLQLNDIGFTDLLQSVSATVANSLGKILLTQDQSGTLSFEINQDETLSLGVYAVAGGSRKFGLYTLDSCFTPTVVTQVPLPAAGWLLASAVALLPLFRRRCLALATA